MPDPVTQPQYKGLPQGAKIMEYEGLPEGATVMSSKPTQSNQIQPTQTPAVTSPAQAPTIKATPQKTQSYWERLITDLNERRAKMDEIANRVKDDPRPGSTLLGLTNIVGQSALALTDTVSEALVSGWRTLAPNEMKKFLTDNIPDFLADLATSGATTMNFAGKKVTPEQFESYKKFIKTHMGKKAVKALAQGYESFENFNDKYPEVGETFETLLGFSMLNVSKLLTREAALGLSDAATITKNTGKQTLRDVREAIGTETARTNRLNKQFSNAVRTELPKVINIAGKGKQTMKQKMAYLDKAEDAMKEIVYNKDNFVLRNLKGEILENKLPVNSKTAILDTIQVIDQSKKLLGPEIETMLAEADATGKFVNFGNAIKSIENFISSASITSRPDTDALVKSGEKMIKYYKQLGDVSPSFVYENFIKDRNRLMRDIGAFLQPTISDTEKAGLFAAELSGLNKSFKSILSESGNNIFKRYSNLLTIEDDFMRSFRTAATDSGVDYATAYSAIEAVKFATQGVHNPSTLGLAHVFAKITKRLPEQRLSRMFKKAESIMSKIEPPKPVEMKSAVGKTLQSKLSAFDAAIGQ